MPTVSTKPWGNFKSSDYTPEQYKAACLIVRGNGNAKFLCLLPVKEPDGTLNINGMAAAAGSLAGARGGVKASPAEISAAKAKLLKYYGQTDRDAPDSLKHATKFDVENFLKHIQSTNSTTTNTTAAVVALPSPLDPIRLVGDEEKHATLLFLGETSTLPAGAKDELLNTIAQVAKMQQPFREEVLNISRLGSDDPPALVAMLSGRNLQGLHDALQVNPRVAEYMKNAPQYPSYTPHVTLAYPDFQGEAAIRAIVSGLYRVNFDRLALWWGNEQTEFSLSNLGDVGDDGPRMAMSEQVENFLAHHGVLGMKWGVRRPRGSDGTVTGRLRAKLGAKIAGKEAEGGSSGGHGGGGSGSSSSSEGEHMSVDAQRFVHTISKQGYEMSDREIKEANNRIESVKKYNSLMNDPNGEIRAKVEQMRLQKDYAQLKAELNPSRKQKVDRFISNVQKGFDDFDKLNKSTHGVLGDLIYAKAGLQGANPKHREGGGAHRAA